MTEDELKINLTYVKGEFSTKNCLCMPVDSLFFTREDGNIYVNNVMFTMLARKVFKMLTDVEKSKIPILTNDGEADEWGKNSNNF